MPEANRLGVEEPLEKRVELLVDTTCYIVFAYIAQGLFERHKLIVATQLCMSILKGKGELVFNKFDYLLRGPKVMGVDNPLADWVSDSVWGSVQALRELEEYQVGRIRIEATGVTDRCRAYTKKDPVSITAVHDLMLSVPASPPDCTPEPPR